MLHVQVRIIVFRPSADSQPASPDDWANRFGPLLGRRDRRPITQVHNALIFQDLEGAIIRFPQGVNHLTGVTAVNYARDPFITPQDRLERQESLFRTLLTTIAADKLFAHPVTTVHVLNAVTTMLAVDSNFTNADIDSLIKQFGSLTADAATFLTAPTQTAGNNQVLVPALDAPLWAAVKNGSLAAYAKANPATVTPAEAP